MHTLGRRLICFWFALWVWSPAWAAAEPALTVLHAGQSRVLTLSALLAGIPGRELTVVNPDLQRPVRYLVLPLDAVLAQAGVAVTGAAAGEDLVFHCLDGYRSSTAFGNVQALGLFLAVGEDGVPGRWSPIPIGKLVNDPAPFIVISANSSDPKVFSWPYQVHQIEVATFAQRFPRVLPAPSAAGAVARGFELFKEQCLRCHSINLQGGDVGPELNIPRNITEYRDQGFLRAWLRDPASFRARSRMPAPALTPAEIDDVLAYLAHMGDRKAGLE